MTEVEDGVAVEECHHDREPIFARYFSYRPDDEHSLYLDTYGEKGGPAVKDILVSLRGLERVRFSV